MKITIGLNMIVKNEAHVIRRCFDSILKEKLIDYWCIVDTGSTDGTQNIIKQYFEQKGIPGELVEFPFTNFAECRNLALAGLKGKCDYGFRIDADEELIYQPQFSLDKLKSDIEKNNYDYVGLRVQSKNNSSAGIHFIKMSLDWTWHGYVHEYLTVKDVDFTKLTNILVGSAYIQYNEDGDSWKQGQEVKNKRYVELLEKQIADEPENPRWIFYLGQSYAFMGGVENMRTAIGYYEQRAAIKMKEIDDEAYISKLYALMLRKDVGDNLNPQEIIDCGLLNPKRFEHLGLAIAYYQGIRQWEAAYQISLEAIKVYMHPPLTGESELFVNIAFYTFSCAYSHVLNCLATKRAKEGLDLLNLMFRNIKSGASIPLATEPQMLRLKSDLEKLNMKIA